MVGITMDALKLSRPENSADFILTCRQDQVN
jgi:hypothetical protein